MATEQAAIAGINAEHAYVIARTASVVAIVIGCAGLAGGMLDIPLLTSMRSGFTMMVMNTALSFILSGAALLSNIDPATTPLARQSSRFLAAVVVAVAVATLFEYVTGVQLGIDELLRATSDVTTAPTPGRMAPNTSLGFALLGTALLMTDSHSRVLTRLCGVAAIIAFTIGFIALTGYSLSVTALYGVAGYTSMAIPTAVGITVLAVGILAMRPERGIAAILVQDGPAGTSVRRLFPLLLVAPVAIGWLRLRGQEAGYYGTEFGIALTASASAVLFASLALWNAREQGRSDTRATERFRMAIEAAPTGMMLIDAHGLIVLVNTHVEALFGYPRQELLGRPLESIVPERLRSAHAHHRSSFAEKPEARRMGIGRDLFGRRKDGTEVPIEIALNPLTTSEGDFVLASIADISERKRGEKEREDLLERLHHLNAELEERVVARTAELTTTLKEREVLLQEVHHRVKNNLQVIASLINMQMRKLEPGASRTGLEECRSRVDAIAMIHAKLYQSQDYSSVQFAEYARGLASSIFHAMGVSANNVALRMEIGSVSLTVDKAIPCGLILNELITNALKHAFPQNRHGIVQVQLQPSADGDMVLVVTDDGVGIPADFNPHHSESLGMLLVSTLTEQLDGRLEITRGRGTAIRIIFPAEGQQ